MCSSIVKKSVCSDWVSIDDENVRADCFALWLARVSGEVHTLDVQVRWFLSEPLLILFFCSTFFVLYAYTSMVYHEIEGCFTQADFLKIVAWISGILNLSHTSHGDLSEVFPIGLVAFSHDASEVFQMYGVIDYKRRVSYSYFIMVLPYSFLLREAKRH
jgi:hypothetical protein